MITLDTFVRALALGLGSRVGQTRRGETPVRLEHALFVALITAIGSAVLLSGAYAIARRSLVCKGIVGGITTCVVLMGSFAAPASATSYTVRGHTYVSNLDCPYIIASIDNNNGDQPRLSTYASLDWYSSIFGQCGNTSYEALPGHIAVAEDVGWNSGSGWVTCNAGAWYYNNTTSHSVQTGFTWRAAPCGPGYYENYAASYDLNGTWNGSWTWTNDIYLSS